MTTQGSTTGTTDEPQAPLAEAGREVGSTATRLADQATDVAYGRADEGRIQAADGIDQLAESFRRVSTDIETDQPSIAGLTSTAAEQAERFSSYLQRTDARTLVSDIEELARRQPILFLGGAFVLGLAASRFLKAGAAQPGERRYRSTDGYQTNSTFSQAVGPGSRRSRASDSPAGEM